MQRALDSKKIVRLGQFVIVFIFGGVFLWLVLAPLHGAVVASGVVKVENYRKTIRHNEGGVVQEILIRDGQRVAAGEALIELDAGQASASSTILRSALDSELSRKARLEAEALLRPEVVFPEVLLARRESPAVAEILERERRLFLARLQTLRSQTASLEKQIVQIDREYEALTAQAGAESGAGDLAREELKSYQILRDKNFISTPRLLEQQRRVLDYQSRLEERGAERARALRMKEELKLKIISLQSDYSRGAAEELKESTAKVLELSDRLRPIDDVLSRRTIRAPVSGTILGLKAHTTGASISANEVLLEIVPDETTLLIEAQVDPGAIKELHVGQVADIRFPALPYRTTPLVEGKVSYIAADVQTDRDGRLFYQVHVLPSAESLAVARIPALQPGMVAEVYIQTQARTALEYLLKPLTDSMARSFRER